MSVLPFYFIFLDLWPEKARLCLGNLSCRMLILTTEFICTFCEIRVVLTSAWWPLISHGKWCHADWALSVWGLLVTDLLWSLVAYWSTMPYIIQNYVQSLNRHRKIWKCLVFTVYTEWLFWSLACFCSKSSLPLTCCRSLGKWLNFIVIQPMMCPLYRLSEMDHILCSMSPLCSINTYDSYTCNGVLPWLYLDILIM